MGGTGQASPGDVAWGHQQSTLFGGRIDGERAEVSFVGVLPILGKDPPICDAKYKNFACWYFGT